MKNKICLASLGLITCLSVMSVKGAVLPTVPMQGAMVMPMIRYDAAGGRLHVMVDPATPQLTPLLVSNPADSFDPADPWYEGLDPRAQGLAFSRRYGFVMNTETDPLPSGTAILLRKLSSTPELGLYRYRSTSPKSWSPIFGTSGSPDALIWDGMMFHPGVTAPAGTNGHSASFEAVLVDQASGADLPGTSTGPFELKWTNIPDGRPTLAVAYKVTIACPAGNEWVLESADALNASSWSTVTNAPVQLDGQSTVVLEASAGKKFYRMRRTP